MLHNLNLFSSIHKFKKDKDKDKEDKENFGKTQIRENYGSNSGLSVLVNVILWIYGLFITIKYWYQLPTWAKILAVLGLLFGGPIVTIIAVYIGKNQTKQNFSFEHYKF